MLSEQVDEVYCSLYITELGARRAPSVDISHQDCTVQEINHRDCAAGGVRYQPDINNMVLLLRSTAVPSYKSPRMSLPKRYAVYKLTSELHPTGTDLYGENLQV